MMKFLKRAVLALVFITILFGAVFYLAARLQGPMPDSSHALFQKKKVSIDWDQDGIPIITAATWLEFAWGQGFAVASQRLWQMELMRRAGKGTLSELFGTAAISYDKGQVVHDWLAIAEQAARDLPKDEREICDAYSEGVNAFITDSPFRWGLEFLILRTKPSPWQCSDTLLVYLSLARDLSDTAEKDWQEFPWREKLSDSWKNILFGHHPTAQPLFGSIPEREQFDWPPSPDQFLPSVEPDSLLKQALREKSATDQIAGSNNWGVVQGHSAFLANDPHLTRRVPSIWFALRGRIGNDLWVAGVSLPGMPGLVLGMNQYYAWAFTNSMEDVDDYLIEELDSDGTSYRAHDQDWRPILKKEYSIKVRDQDKPEVVTGLFTHRGPLLQREKVNGEKLWVSKQWLGYTPSTLRIPSIRLNSARNWQEFNQAVDSFLIPSQNILYMDRQNQFGYRLSGVSPIRKSSGLMPLPASQGEWQGLGHVDQRPRRLFAKPDDGKTFSFVTANHEIWIDAYGSRFFGEERRLAIESRLDQANHLSAESMAAIQLDSRVRYFNELAIWLQNQSQDAKQFLGDDLKPDFDSHSHPELFQKMVLVDELLQAIVNLRFESFLFSAQEAANVEPYRWRSRFGLFSRIMASEAGFQPMGLNNKDLADTLIKGAQQKFDLQSTSYSEKNRWTSQHPFVNRVPILGSLYALDEMPQFGHDLAINVEDGDFGASVRMIWDLANPMNSRWSLAVGQSGHLFSPFYKNFHQDWFNGVYRKVLPEDWNGENLAMHPF